MKKATAFVLAILLLASNAGSSYTYAGNTVSRNQTATGFLKDVSYTSDGTNEAVVINAVKYEDYSTMELTDPRRIIVDLFNAQSTGKQQIIQAGGKVIKRIRYAQFDPYTARVVLEVNSEAEYGIEKTDTGLILYIGEKPGTHAAEEPSGKEGTGAGAGGNATGGTQGTGGTGGSGAAGGAGETGASNAATGSAISNAPGTGKQTVTINGKFRIQYLPGGQREDIAVLLSSYKGYKVMRLTDPDRLQISLPNTKYTSVPKQVNLNGSQVKALSVGKSSKGTALITLELNAQSQYGVSEEKDGLVVSIQPPTYKHIRYHNSGDRVYFTLDDAVLTSGDEFLKELYSGSYDETGFDYSVTFPTGQADLGNGKMDIGDKYLKSVEVMTNPAEGTTSIVFHGAGRYVYFPYTRSNPGITAITVLKPAAEGEKIVAIDAGHGGGMTGAIFRSLYEKDLNLDIAKRLNALLEKKGVKTYMLREDDSDVANYERAYIANKLGAKLYLSIHNNAMDNRSYRGTMSLYCPSGGEGFTGKDFAEIIQSKLLARLKTMDRAVRDRPDLIVLKATNMPAALAEIAFLTNSTDRSNLQKPSFRQNAAQALCDSVAKALTQIR